MSVFPTLFSPNMTYPYDSFNVEDLHTVDNGVIRHLFPLLHDGSKPADVMIGHFLGVDHVGHRVGPDHPVMKEKLEQMDNVLREVVDVLDDQTLLIVLGDHGMDSKGDHGGDGVLETSAAMWIYSKKNPLSIPSDATPRTPASASIITPKATFPGASQSFRHIQQIDILPSLSLLLGLPIPFNNLGTIIPELFTRPVGGSDPKRSTKCALDEALRLNAEQVRQYLGAYRASVSGSDLDTMWDALESSWNELQNPIQNTKYGHDISECGETDLDAYYSFTRFSLEACRAMWAQFNVGLISVGLLVLLLSVVSGTLVYLKLRSVSDWEGWTAKRISKAVRHISFGAIASILVYIPLRLSSIQLAFLDIFLAFTSIASFAALIFDTASSLGFLSITSTPVVLVLHALSFFSNSFTFWEDRSLTYLLLSALVPSLIYGSTAPDQRLKRRIWFFGIVYAVCVRLMALSTVCREEQQPYCHVTFYASSTLPSPPLIVRIISIPIAIVLPTVLRQVLAISKSDKGLAPRFLSVLLRPILLSSSLCWVLEWIESSGVSIAGADRAPQVRLARTVVAWAGVALLALSYLIWRTRPNCFELRRLETSSSKTKLDASNTNSPKVTMILNSNAYGAPLLLFWALFLGLIYLTSQLSAQVALFFGTLALLAHLELSDSVRDAQALEASFNSQKLSAALEMQRTGLQNSPFGFTMHIAPIAMLSLHAFYATGHQATFPSLQWKSAFLLTPTLTYPLAPILVLLNTFGPQFLFALATPLLACWQVAPSPSIGPRQSRLLGESLRASVGLSLYYSILLLSSAVSAAWLRRHLMVWKVFAPRFIYAAVGLLVVDLALLLACGLGVTRTTAEVGRIVDALGAGNENGVSQNSKQEDKKIR